MGQSLLVCRPKQFQISYNYLIQIKVQLKSNTHVCPHHAFYGVAEDGAFLIHDMDDMSEQPGQ